MTEIVFGRQQRGHNMNSPAWSVGRKGNWQTPCEATIR